MTEEPRIEFPCIYPLKIVGDAAEDFQDRILDILKQHDPSMSLDKIREKKSRKGNYQSFTALFQAQSAEHVSRVYEDLMRYKNIRMVF